MIQAFAEYLRSGAVTPLKRMKNAPVKLIDKVMLRKRALIETINDQLKPICQMGHSRQCNPFNFLVILMAYTYQGKKPALNLESQGLTALPEVIF